MASQDHAKDEARAQYESIAAMVRALECDYARLEDLREERTELRDAVKEATGDEARQAAKNLVDWDVDNAEELAELEDAADDYEDADAARKAIEEDPLSVQVRSGWCDPGGVFEPEEFEILLCTGGPAVRIRGELNEYNQPRRAWLEYQDWGTPWTEYLDADQDTLLTYCGCFYYGEE